MNADIISTIRAHPVLYVSGKSKVGSEKERKECWKHIAIEFGVQSAKKLEEMWMETIDEYTAYLREGGDFPLQTEMQFMQQHLLNNSEASQSDSDEGDLIEYLLADIDSIPQLKKFKKESKTTLPVENGNGQKFITMAPCRTCGCPNNESKHCHIQPGPITGMPSPQTSKEPQHSFGNNVNNFSSTELIFLGYAKTLQRMPSYLQWQTKQQIAEIVNAAELKLIGTEKLKTRSNSK